MLAKRVIPQLLCRGRQLVKGRQFNSWRSVGVAAQAVRIFQRREVDELILLDIGATPDGRGPDLSLIEELSDVCFMPLTVGGGIKTLSDARAVLRAGADKVAVGAGGAQAVRVIANSLGCQAVVSIIDYRESDNLMSVLFKAQEMNSSGAGEILLQCIDREGVMEGYDLDTVRKVAHAVDIPVIVSGGCGEYAHMLAAIAAGADAVAAGSLFQFTDATPKGAARFLHERGVEVRL